MWWLGLGKNRNLSMCQAFWDIKHVYQEIRRKSLEGQIKWACHCASESMWELPISDAVDLTKSRARSTMRN